MMINSDIYNKKSTLTIVKINVIACCVLLLSGCTTARSETPHTVLTTDGSYTQPNKKTKNDNTIHYKNINGNKYIVDTLDAEKLKVKSFYSSGKDLKSNRYTMMQVSMLSEMGFDFDSSALKPSAHKILNSISMQLKKSPSVYAVIVGHTDSDGSAKYNSRLSARRADSAASYIIRQGASIERIYRIAAGEEYPIAPNTSLTNKAKNRRVDIFLSTDKDLIVSYFTEHSCVTNYCQPRKLNIVGYNKKIQPSSKVKRPVAFQKEITTPEHMKKRDTVVNTKTRGTNTNKITYRETPTKNSTIRDLNVKAITREPPRNIDSEYLVLDDDQYRQGL